MLYQGDESIMANRLSYSQSRLYSECGMKYKFYYKDKLRERTKSGALLFGSAVDKAWEAKLKALAKGEDIDEYAVFDFSWSKAEINGKLFDAPECTLIGYGAADFDAEILTSDDRKFLAAKVVEMCPSLAADDIEDSYKKLADYRSMNDNGKRDWEGNEKALHNLFNWFSMRRKGYLMLDANRKHVLPRIKEIKGVQKTGELKNENGDTVISYLDLECIWEDGKHVIFDYKTSAREYDVDAVITSQQLSIYAFTHSVPYGGYFVFRKQIRKNRTKVCTVCNFNGTGGRHKTCSAEVDGKRCGGEWTETITPECDVDILIDAIPERTREIVLENLNTINEGISKEIFSRNFNSCKTGYGRCPYFNLCYKNDDKELEKV